MRIVQCKNATASCFSHVQAKHFLVETEDSPDGPDGPEGPDGPGKGGQFFNRLRNMI